MPSSTPLSVDDAAFLQILDRFNRIARLSVVKAVGHQIDAASYPLAHDDDLESSFARFLSGLPAEKLKPVLDRGHSLLTADPATKTRHFGDLANIDLHAPASVVNEAQKITLQGLPPIDLGKLRKALHVLAPTNAAPVSHRVAPRAFAAVGKGQNIVQFSADNLHCDKVTGLVGFEGDDMFIGGIAVDGVGNVTQINPFEVGKFSKGDTQGVQNNPFTNLPIDTSWGNWPKTFYVTVVIAERHSGGIYNFIYKLADTAKSAILEKVGSAVSSTVGAYIGGIVGSAIGPLGTLLGAGVGFLVGLALGWVFDQVLGWLKQNLFGDDIFKPALNQLTLSGPGDLWNGSSTSPETTWDFKGFHGEYHLTCHWSLFWGQPQVNGCGHMAWDGSKWTDWESLGGSANFGYAVASLGKGQLDVFGVGTDDALYHRAFRPDAQGWRDWEPLGGQLTSGPAATANSGNRIDIVARGLNDETWHMAWDGSKWTDWESLGGSAISDPAICSLGSGQLDVFTVGTDKALIHKAYRPDDQGWRKWESLGGTLTSSPFVTVVNGNRIDIVARWSDDATWHMAWDGSKWTDWESLGGSANFHPAVASLKGLELDVFSISTDFILYHKAYRPDGQGWREWEPLGGTVSSGPAAVVIDGTRIDIVARQ
jgi:hypothetical protein